MDSMAKAVSSARFERNISYPDCLVILVFRFFCYILKTKNWILVRKDDFVWGSREDMTDLPSDLGTTATAQCPTMAVFKLVPLHPADQSCTRKTRPGSTTSVRGVVIATARAKPIYTGFNLNPLHVIERRGLLIYHHGSCTSESAFGLKMSIGTPDCLCAVPW